MSTPHNVFRGYTWDLPAMVPTVFDIGRRRFETGSLTRRFAHRWWILDYSIGDGGLVRVGGTSEPWRQRPRSTAHLYAPGTPYWEDTRSVEGAIESCWVGFVSGEQAELNELTAESGYCRLEDPQGEIRDRILAIGSTGQDLHERGFWRAQSHFMQIVDLLLASHRIDGTTRRISGELGSQQVPELVARVRGHLLSNYGQQLSLAAIARAVNVGVSTLSHRYRREAGESPMATLSSIRLSAAEGLLLKGEGLKTVAAHTGYCDEFHLSKAFKQKRGVSPREFVRNAHVRSNVRMGE